MPNSEGLPKSLPAAEIASSREGSSIMPPKEGSNRSEQDAPSNVSPYDEIISIIRGMREEHEKNALSSDGGVLFDKSGGEDGAEDPFKGPGESGEMGEEVEVVVKQEFEVQQHGIESSQVPAATPSVKGVGGVGKVFGLQSETLHREQAGQDGVFSLNALPKSEIVAGKQKRKREQYEKPQPLWLKEEQKRWRLEENQRRNEFEREQQRLRSYWEKSELWKLREEFEREHRERWDKENQRRKEFEREHRERWIQGEQQHGIESSQVPAATPSVKGVGGVGKVFGLQSETLHREQAGQDGVFSLNALPKSEIVAGMSKEKRGFEREHRERWLAEQKRKSEFIEDQRQKSREFYEASLGLQPEQQRVLEQRFKREQHERWQLEDQRQNRFIEDQRQKSREFKAGQRFKTGQLFEADHQRRLEKERRFQENPQRWLEKERRQLEEDRRRLEEEQQRYEFEKERRQLEEDRRRLEEDRRRFEKERRW